MPTQGPLEKSDSAIARPEETKTHQKIFPLSPAVRLSVPKYSKNTFTDTLYHADAEIIV